MAKKTLNSAAGSGVNLDGAKEGSAGGWETEDQAPPNAPVSDAASFAQAVAARRGVSVQETTAQEGGQQPLLFAVRRNFKE